MGKRKTNIILTVLAVVLILAIAGLGVLWHYTTWEWPFGENGGKSSDIVLLATSDVHCQTDENIGYAGLAAYKKKMEQTFRYVTLIDSGDAVQGEPIGTISNGEYLIDIMNYVGYDIAVPGNHEFDYGMDQFLSKLVKKSEATYLSCNFTKVNGDKVGGTVLEPYSIISYGRKKVAFIGISSPESFTKSTPSFFQNEKGEYIYGFCQGNEGKDLYERVQDTIDDVKSQGADYVVGVCHLGDDKASSPWTSTDLINNTKGFDGIFDGHSHNKITSSVKDKDGKDVAVVSGGANLEAIGKLEIKSDGTVVTSLITAEEASEKDEETEAYIQKIKDKFDQMLNETVAETKVTLSINDKNGKRAIRSQETNLGDLCADAYRKVLGADIALINGGGIRSEIPAGSITYGQIIQVHPFGNKACVIEATGQQIADALELGAMNVGRGESGGFLQVSGLTYKINRYMYTSVKLNDKGEFVSANKYWLKVSNIMIGGKPLDLKKTYTVASHDYLLKSGGDGFTMFKGNKILQDGVYIDNQVLIKYIKDVLGGVIGDEYAEPQGRIIIN